MLGLLKTLLGLFDPLSRIAKQISEYKLAAQTLDNDREKLYHEERIKQLETQQSLLLEGMKYRMTRWIRPAFAFPFVVYNLKVIVWDKVLGLGVTDPLSADLWRIELVVIGFYFAGRPLEKWLQGKK